MDKADQIETVAGWASTEPRAAFRVAETFLGEMGLVTPGAQALAFVLSVALFALVLGVLACRSAPKGVSVTRVPVTVGRMATARPASRRG